MKKRTLTLVLAASAVYYLVLFLSLSLLPPGYNPPLYFLVVPLIVPVLILARDLAERAIVPLEVRPRTPSRKLSRDIQALTRQIEVGWRSSPDYFEKVLVERLREALAGKVAVETGMDLGRVREILANPRLGPGLLRNEKLYRLLYSGVPAKGRARVAMLEETTALVEAWKP